MPGQRTIIAWRNIQKTSDFFSRNRSDIKGFDESTALREMWLKGSLKFDRRRYTKAIKLFYVRSPYPYLVRSIFRCP